jgi:cytochrome oxidase Cu insertion factor (SCO1/SenC/PrrC family)
MNPNSVIYFSFSISLLASLLFISCNSESDSTQADTNRAEAANVSMAPDFEVTTLDGETISLQQSLDEGKPVVIYFTASWCPTCARNWPVLSEVYPEFKDRLTLVAISIDPTDTEEVMRELAAEKGFLFPSTKGHPDIMIDFGVESQATTVGVSRDGSIAFTRPGQALTANEFRDLFTSLVN